MGRSWIALMAAAVGMAGSASAAKEAQAPQSATPPGQAERAPSEKQPSEGRTEAQEPIEPILVQGYVKSVGREQLTLTAPGAPVDLPLSLVEETRFIRGEKDVERSSLQEGQLVRAALLPMGEDLVALVVEVVPDEPAPAEKAAPGAQTGPSGKGSGEAGDGLQGEKPPSEPAPIEPQPTRPSPAEPAPAPMPDEGGDATRL